MTISTQAPTAQQRKRRTRTTTVSTRLALAVSTLLPIDIDLLPGTEHLRCPDCTTWCPITGAQGSTPKLVPHHTERAGTPGARRCSGSNRQVLLDLTIAEWQQQWADAAKETSSRRPTTVLKKVKAPAPKAVLHIAQRRSDDPVGSDKQRAKRRMEEWKKTLPAVTDANSRRAEPLDGAVGPIRGIEVPTETLRPAA